MKRNLLCFITAFAIIFTTMSLPVMANGKTPSPIISDDQASLIVTAYEIVNNINEEYGTDMRLVSPEEMFLLYGIKTEYVSDTQVTNKSLRDFENRLRELATVTIPRLKMESDLVEEKMQHSNTLSEISNEEILNTYNVSGSINSIDGHQHLILG